jgi:hypothetical protein
MPPVVFKAPAQQQAALTRDQPRPPTHPPTPRPPPPPQLNDRYEFPEELDLDRDNYLSRNADRGVRNLYKLHSVLVHSGGVHGGRGRGRFRARGPSAPSPAA